MRWVTDSRVSPCVVSRRGHGGPVVGEEGAGQPSLEEGLREAVDQALGRLVEIPLGVTDQARAIVQDGEQDRT